MRWDGQSSTNVEDRRGMSGGRIAGGLGVGTIVMAIIIALMGGNPLDVILGGGMPAPQEQVQPDGSYAESEEERVLRQRVEQTLKLTEDAWGDMFPKQVNRRYEQPRLVLFSGGVQSACGQASAAMGPFYCPGDRKVYIDLSFYQELKNRFGAGGDFAQAYVIAHEVGHHIQTLLGISEQVQQRRQQVSETESNRLSVRMELQADYLAGMWARYVQDHTGRLETGDIQEAIRAAEAIGDDAIQRQATGRVVPDSFTHGTSEQRMRWFQKGFDGGTLEASMEAFQSDYARLWQAERAGNER